MVLTLTLALGALTPIQSLSDEYLRELWKSSPMAASQAGYHRDGVDARLDDLSPEARERRIAWLRGFARRLQTAVGAPSASPSLDREDAADAALLESRTTLELLGLTE